jgi:hypothetical protein
MIRKQQANPSFDNVYDATASNDVFDCMEGAYLKGFFVTLHELLGANFNKWRFLVIHHNQKYGPPPLSIKGNDVVLVWLSDESGHVPLELRDSFKLILKSYWPHKEPVDNIYPFPLCGCSEVLHTPPKPLAKREINVFFSGNLNANRLDFYRQFSWLRKVPPSDLRSYRLRLALLKVLKATKVNLNRDVSGSFTDSFIQFTGGFRQGLQPNEYAHKLSDTKIALCPPGFHSAETIRHFEAMRMGCVVVSALLPPNPFYIGSPIIQVKSWRDLHSSINKLLSDQKRLEMLSEQSTIWWKAKCSPEALANKTDMLLNR